MTINIAYSCNEFYVPQTGISMISVFENNKDIDEINIFFISKDVSEDGIQVLKDICETYGRNLLLVPFESIAYDLNITSTGRHIETVYAKIFFSRIEGLNKILYLDSDTIVVGDLTELWNTDLSDFCMGMVETPSDRSRSVLNINPLNQFFNDGVVLVNVEYCRDFGLIEKANKLIEDYSGNPPVLSEGILNAICQDSILSLKPQFNLMSGFLEYAMSNAKYLSSKLSYSVEEIQFACSNPVVIHYLSAFYNRPWFVNCTHPYKQKYLYYKSISIWKDTELLYKPIPLKLRIIKKLISVFGIKFVDKMSYQTHTFKKMSYRKL